MWMQGLWVVGALFFSFTKLEKHYLYLVHKDQCF